MNIYVKKTVHEKKKKKKKKLWRNFSLRVKKEQRNKEKTIGFI
jgi:hypothetical protein